MPNKKKTKVSRATVSVKTKGTDATIWDIAWRAWVRGDRHLLLQIWDCYGNGQIPPNLQDLMRHLIEHASIPSPAMTKRKPGRPRLTSRIHDDAQRAEIVRTVKWLRKIKPCMSCDHARELTAERYGVSASLVKTYCLARPRK